MSATMTEEPQKVKYWAGQHTGVLKRHGHRTADNWARFLYPYLDALPPTFTFFDLGCGPGSITCDLAQRYPSASFLGIDTGDKAIEAAVALAAERKVGNVKFEVGDLLEMPKDEKHVGKYDVVFTQQVLIHMQRPVAGLQAMKALAKPAGGLVGAREISRSGMQYWPQDDMLDWWVTTRVDMIEENGSDGWTGKKLIEFALKAGWTRDQIEFQLGASTVSGPEKVREFAEASIAPMKDAESEARVRLVQSGRADEEKLGKLVEAFERWAAREDSWTAFVVGELVCRNG